ncbi:NAD(P)/FAD-dependent oxidoreductase [Rhodoferax sp.]|uniref:NAD(P)/FAD-dependent oxidoreductase n=1 Tax=Rhodoferax sp. TaxID=50421 RepID=UPI0027509E4D|nr:FAD-dependent monooxygenase [Rhodoferax sp.]
MPTQFDAIVIGAGPAGSTAAILLARAGWSVALIEKQRFPRRKVCGECIAASNLPLLAALGLGSALDACAGPELKQVALMRGQRTVLADLPPAPHDQYRWGKALGRETLDTLLVEQARTAGAQVWQPWSLQAIEGAVGAWRCKVRSIDSDETRCLQSPVVIDAHGSWEALPMGRRRLARSASDLFAFKANFDQANLETGLLPVLTFNGGYGGMVVAGGGLTTVACCVRRDRLDAGRRDTPDVPAGHVMEALLRHECKGVRDALQGATRQGAWLATGPLEPGIRLGAEDGVFRIGNAAGEAHPIIGEGMSMALQSAWLLCEHLLSPALRQESPASAWQARVARRYALDWRRHFQPRLRLASVFAHAAMRPMLAAPLLTMAQYWPGMLTLGATLGGKTRFVADLAAMTKPAPLAALALAGHGAPATPTPTRHSRSPPHEYHL